MADVIEVPAPDDVISSSKEMKEWLFKVTKTAVEDGYITHVGDAPVKSVGAFDLDEPFDEDAQVFAIQFGENEDEEGEMPIHVGPIIYLDDVIE